MQFKTIKTNSLPSSSNDQQEGGEGMNKLTEHKVMFLIYCAINAWAYQFLDKGLLQFGIVTFCSMGGYVHLEKVRGVTTDKTQTKGSE